jgi:hypothetical protein
VIGGTYRRENGDICRVSNVVTDIETHEYFVIFQKTGCDYLIMVTMERFYENFTEMPLQENENAEKIYAGKWRAKQ